MKSVKSAAFLVILCVAWFGTAAAQTQTVRPQAQSGGDMLVLSLPSSDDLSSDHREHLRKALLGTSAEDLRAEIFEMQMEITRKTAGFGPVLLLVPDEATKTAVYRACKDYEICDLFRTDRLRMKVVRHQGVWIRDFGPQIEVQAGAVRVVHWRYFDVRREEEKQAALAQVDSMRAKLLEAYMGDNSDSDIELRIGGGIPSKEAAGGDPFESAIEHQLALLREYSDILRTRSVQRSEDENSAYEVADAALLQPSFQFASSKLAVDGGNLLKLEDGRCLTTRVLLARNKDQQDALVTELRRIGGCKEVTFLDPLPGPVIEHVDMFALPAGGQRILLPSYDLSSPFAKAHWAELSDVQRYLVLNAALAMKQNEERLQALGYEVREVPSPFPRMRDSQPYYPTVLNAVVRASEDGRRQVLMPEYKGYEEDIQQAAKHVLEEAFGPKSEIVGIEASAAAQAQGAVHCLTITVPLSQSIFADKHDAIRRQEYRVAKEGLDQSLVRELLAEIPPSGLQGLWGTIENGEKESSSAATGAITKFHFTQNQIELGILGQRRSSWQYETTKPRADNWELKLSDGEHLSTWTVRWKSGDMVQLTTAGTTFVLKRVNSDPVSPFKTPTTLSSFLPGDDDEASGEAAGSNASARPATLKRKPRRQKPGSRPPDR